MRTTVAPTALLKVRRPGRYDQGVTDATAVGAVDAKVDGVTDPPTRQSRRRYDWATIVVALAAAASLVPFVVAGVRGVATPWTPVSDQAIEALRMHDVGTRYTPLLGAYSRLGWRHPGPLLFWIGAPFLRLLGPSGLFMAVAAINLAALAGALAAARRLGGRVLMGSVAAVASVMVHTLGPVRLVDPWNPHVTYLPLLCFVLCAAAAAEGVARWALPAAVVSGSFVAQSHLGAAPVVVGGTIGAAVWWWSIRPGGAALPRPWRTGLVFIALWSGPLVDQAVGRHNLTDLADYFLGGNGARASLREALGAAARQFGLRPAWTGGPEVSFLGRVVPAPLWTLAASATALVATWLAARRQDDGVPRRLVGYAGWLGLVSVAAMTRTTGGLLAYVLRWTWPIAVLGAAAVVLVAGRSLTGRPTTRQAGALATVVAVVAVVAATATTVDVLRTDLRPSARYSIATASLSEGVRQRLPVGRYGLTWMDPLAFIGVPQSLGMDLERRGYDIVFPPSEAYAVERRRTGTAPDRPTIMVVGGRFRTDFEEPSGSRRLAMHRPPLAEVDQEQVASLRARIRADTTGPTGPLDAEADIAALIEDGADPRDVTELIYLQSETPYDVWLIPPAQQK